MKSQVVSALLLLLASSLLVDLAWAQTQNQGGRRNRGGNNNNNNNNAPTIKLPDDPRLLELHRALVRDAEKLALEYQKGKQLDKARIIYGEILRFMPTYDKAASSLQKIRGAEATAERKVVDVVANKAWQDTGIDIVEGRPVVFRVFDGKWHLLMDYPVGPDGIEIPKELRQFNLGALIGIITPPGQKPGEASQEPPPSADTKSEENNAAGGAAQPAEGEQANKDSAASTNSDSSGEEKKEEEPKGPRPFLIGTKLDLIAPSSGRLYLRMYDAQPDDNTGKLKVTITGTFAPPPTYAGSKESSTLSQP